MECTVIAAYGRPGALGVVSTALNLAASATWDPQPNWKHTVGHNCLNKNGRKKSVPETHLRPHPRSRVRRHHAPSLQKSYEHGREHHHRQGHYHAPRGDRLQDTLQSGLLRNPSHLRLDVNRIKNDRRVKSVVPARDEAYTPCSSAAENTETTKQQIFSDSR